MKWPDFFVYLIFISTWVMGMACAIPKGMWYIAGAFFPPYAWVLMAQHFMGI